jgi:hypothetical protein
MCGEQPATYLAGLRKKPFFARAMRSHLIPSGSSSSIWHRGVKRCFPKFMDERLEMIAKAFETAQSPFEIRNLYTHSNGMWTIDF